MPLRLTLSNARQWPPGTPTIRVLASGRLTIGRGAGNDWVLPDPERVISKHHCVIERTNGTYRLVDTSSNGVLINESDEPLGADTPYILRHGDRIRIGSYEIDVIIEAHPEPPPRIHHSWDSRGDPFDFDSSQGKPAPVEPVHPAPPLREDKPPETAPDLEPIPITPSPPVSPGRSQADQGPGSEDRLLRAFFAGAGVDPATAAERMADAERMMREAGEIFRIAVAEVIAVLKSRRAQMREVDAALTEFQPAENNPLKFTLGVEDTIRVLLAGGEPGFLPPKQAFEEAFADIKEHQVAVLAGMQEAWMDLLRRLDPKALERRLDEDVGLSKLRILRKARCWDAFIQHYGTVANDAGADSKDLFNWAFRNGLEKHLSTGSKKLR